MDALVLATEGNAFERLASRVLVAAVVTFGPRPVLRVAWIVAQAFAYALVMAAIIDALLGLGLFGP